MRAAPRLLAFACLTLPLMPLQQLLLWFAPSAARHLPHRYHQTVAALLGIRVNVIGKPPKVGPALVVSNHVSWIDIVALSAAMPCSFIAKNEVARWPFFGSLARLQRTVFIDRERRHATGASRSVVTERLRGRDILVLFPEGTSHDGASVLPFRSSYLGAAEDSELPVIPVTLAYARNWGLPMSRRTRPFFAWYGDMDLAPHLWNALRKGPLQIDVIVHEALRPESHRSRKRLAAEAAAMIRQSLAEVLHGRRETR